MRIAVATLIITTAALSLAVYTHLPATVPVHWNADGQIDRYASRAVGAFAMPLAMLAVAALFAALPRLSPSGWEVEAKSRAFRAIVIAILLFMLAVHVQLLLAAMKIGLSIDAFVPLGIGALLVVIGNYMPKLRRNFFIGIRTPWTLADDDVWYRTHRFGGVVFVICGALLMAAGPFFRGRATEIFLLTLIGAAAIVSVVYSYAIYRRPEKEEVSS